MVLCFPYSKASDGTLEPLRQSLARALARVEKQFPTFAGKLVLGTNATGRVMLSKSPGDEFLLDISDDSDSFGWDYAGLRAAGFPAEAFVGPTFDLPYDLVEGGPAIPATVIRARTIQGGLLCVYLHHSVTDGAGMAKFLAALAACTGGSPSTDFPSRLDRVADLPAEIGSALNESRTFEELIQQCPKYAPSPISIGPFVRPDHLSVEKRSVGRIFVFGSEKIKAMKKAAQLSRPSNCSLGRSGNSYPSTYACLTALVWSFATAVRLEIAIENGLGQAVQEEFRRDRDSCRVMSAVHWAGRSFTNLTKDYAGNAWTAVEAKSDLQRLLVTVRSSPETLPAMAKTF